jgi:hypothetical protein
VVGIEAVYDYSGFDFIAGRCIAVTANDAGDNTAITFLEIIPV